MSDNEGDTFEDRGPQRDFSSTGDLTGSSSKAGLTAKDR